MTTGQKVFFILFVIAILSGCVKTPPPTFNNTPMPTQTPNLSVSPAVKQTAIINVTTNESDIIPDSEYEVYSAVILSKNDPRSVKKIVIYPLTYNRTVCYNYECFQNFKNYSLKNDSIEDYKNKNARAYKLENKFSIPQTVILISEEELNQIFQSEKGWDAFNERYPDSSGIIQISRAGFNTNQTQAILYYSYQRGAVWGEGYLFFLTRDEGEWRVKEQVSLWVS